MKQQTHDIFNHTIAFWTERTGEECSSEDARQMVANVSGFFQVLAEWQRRIREEEEKNSS